MPFTDGHSLIRYIEALKFPRVVFPLDVEAVHPRDGRSLAAPVDEGVDIRAGAFQQRFHPSIGQVAHPSDHPAVFRRPLGLPAEGNPLDPPGNQ